MIMIKLRGLWVNWYMYSHFLVSLCFVLEQDTTTCTITESLSTQVKKMVTLVISDSKLWIVLISIVSCSGQYHLFFKPLRRTEITFKSQV